MLPFLTNREPVIQIKDYISQPPLEVIWLKEADSMMGFDFLALILFPNLLKVRGEDWSFSNCLRPQDDIGNGNHTLIRQSRKVGSPRPWIQHHCHNNLGVPTPGCLLSYISGPWICSYGEGYFINLETESQRGLSDLSKVFHPVSDSNPIPDCPMLCTLEGLA